MQKLMPNPIKTMDVIKRLELLFMGLNIFSFIQPWYECVRCMLGGTISYDMLLSVPSYYYRYCIENIISFDNENNLLKRVARSTFFCAAANIIYHPNSLTHFWTMRLLNKKNNWFCMVQIFHLINCIDIKSHFIFTMCINYGKGHELDILEISYITKLRNILNG